jgi:hypothetical protein
MSNFSLNSAAVRRYLARALTGDTERPRPPVTLAGQRPDSVPQPTPPPAPPPPPMWTRPIHDRPKSSHVEPEPGDERNGDYSREQLKRMNARFVERVERAIAAGDERPQSIGAIPLRPR